MTTTARALVSLALVLLVACGSGAGGADAGGVDAPAAGDAATATDTGVPDVAAGDALLGGDAAPQADGGAGDGPTCITAAAPGPSAHNVGQDCLSASCHPTFGAAGSIYSDAAGSQVLSTVTVRVLDANGVTHDGVTCGCGNFIIRDTIAYPATVYVSRCPDTAVMVGELTYGGCNSCHGEGNRVHLP